SPLPSVFSPCSLLLVLYPLLPASCLYHPHIKGPFDGSLISGFNTHSNHFPCIQRIDNTIYPKPCRCIIRRCLLFVAFGNFFEQGVLLIGIDFRTRLFHRRSLNLEQCLGRLATAHHGYFGRWPCKNEPWV